MTNEELAFRLAQDISMDVYDADLILEEYREFLGMNEDNLRVYILNFLRKIAR